MANAVGAVQMELETQRTLFNLSSFTTDTPPDAWRHSSRHSSRVAIGTG